MERKAPHRSMVRRLTFAFALAMLVVPAANRETSPAQRSNPCSALPAACHYTYDARENCCVADPRFDCFDVCF
jgi:hypothetical protein